MSDAAPFDVQPGSRLWIEGGSNLHGWRCEATTFDAVLNPATLNPDSAFVSVSDTGLANDLAVVEIRVAVHALACGAALMNTKLYEALGSDREPNDIFGRFRIAPSAMLGATTDSATITAEGNLTVAGKQRPLVMTVSEVRLSDGRVHATGWVPILMTDFGVQPPTAFFGLLRTDDAIIVRFDLVAVPHRAVVIDAPAAPIAHPRCTTCGSRLTYSPVP
jgi:hypothetical protein